MPIDTAIFREIESLEFYVELGLTGSRKRAMPAFVTAPQAVALLHAMRDDEDAAYEVANRVLDLVHYPNNDPHYTHPFDAAIAVYLRALDVLFSDLARIVGLLIDKQCKNLWWSVPVVERVLRTPPLRGGISALPKFDSFIIDAPVDDWMIVCTSGMSMSDTFRIIQDTEHIIRANVNTFPVVATTTYRVLETDLSGGGVAV